MTAAEIDQLRKLCRSEFERIEQAHAEIEADLTRIEIEMTRVTTKQHRLSNDIPKAMEHMNQLIDALQGAEP